LISDPDKALKHVSNAYRELFGAIWLKPFGFNNTYAITVRQADAEEYGWAKISNLRNVAKDLRAGFTAEFAERPDGYPGLREIYGLRFGEVLDMDPALMYKAIAKKEVDVICAFATDGRIAAFNLKPLEDDQQFFPPYYAAPVIRNDLMEAHPELGDRLSLLSGILDNGTMQRLNYQVDGKKRSPAQVAKEFLKEKGLF
jgi:glycine betaine/choline ABC-type transport system substrate-binding protein